MEVKSNSFDVLPDENLVHICVFIDEDVKTLTNLSLVSRRWLSISCTAIENNLKKFSMANLQSLFNAKWITDKQKDCFFKSKTVLPDDLRQGALSSRARTLLRRAQVAQHIRRSLYNEPVHTLFTKCLLGWKNCTLEQQQEAKEQLKTLVIIGLNPNWCLFAENKQRKAISECLAAGANIEAQDKNGWTALHLAVIKGKADVVSELLKAGANTEAQDKNGWTALHQAADCGKAEAISKLLEAGANIEAQDKDGVTALHWAAIWGKADFVSKLLEAGANIEAQGQGGMTALHLAAIWGKAEAISKLLEAGANIEAQDNLGMTALHLAASRGKAEVISEFLKAGVKHPELVSRFKKV